MFSPVGGQGTQEHTRAQQSTVVVLDSTPRHYRFPWWIVSGRLSAT